MSRPLRVLMVASAGGHIDELRRLYPRMPLAPEAVVWVSSKTAQTQELLDGSDVVWVPHVGPRDRAGAVRMLAPAARVLRQRGITHLVTTGAAMAVPFIVAARARGIPATYIESAARQREPSVTGSIVSRIPGVHLRCQTQVPLGRRWRSVGTVFDEFISVPARPAAEMPPVRRMVVSVGGERFPFHAAIDRLRAQIPSGVEVLWQTGNTPAASVPTAEAWIEPRRLTAAMAAADVVAVHAGVGSALAALEAGRVPLLLVRRAAHGEHIDDHQVQIARELERRGLAVAADPSTVTWSQIAQVAGRIVQRGGDAPPITA